VGHYKAIRCKVLDMSVVSCPGDANLALLQEDLQGLHIGIKLLQLLSAVLHSGGI
jgi:hypothetical protein